MAKKKLTIVVQRYGDQVVGGAESLARAYGEHLSRHFDVDVLTTQAADPVSWANELPPKEFHGGVRIRRFPVSWQRHPLVFGVFNRLLSPLLNGARPSLLNSLLGRLWLALQGPYSRALKREIRASDADVFLVVTYLYLPSIHAIAAHNKRCLLVSTAHDEAPFYFPHVRSFLAGAYRVLTNTSEELALVAETYPELAGSLVTVGTGIQVPEDPDLAINCPSPSLLYLGRLSEGKGVGDLIRWFTRTSLPGDPYLILVGKKDGDLVIPDHPRIDYRGMVSEAQKWAYLKNANLVINPSSHESLSLIVLEAMAVETPVIVNGQSPVLEGYAQGWDTVQSYSDLDQLEGIMSPLLSPNWKRDHKELLTSAARLVKERYDWEQITSRLAQLAHEAASSPISVAVVSSFPPKKCGIATYASSQVSSMRAAGHKVETIGLLPESSGDRTLDLTTIPGLIQLCRRLSRRDFDRIYIHFTDGLLWPKAPGITGLAVKILQPFSFWFLCQLSRASIILVAHELNTTHGRAGPVWTWFKRWALASASQIEVHTKKEAQDLKQYFNRYSIKERIHVVEHGRFYRPKFQGAMNEARKSYGIAAGKTIFLCIGFLKPHKGFQDAIKALGAAGEQEHVLYVVGDADEADPRSVAYARELIDLASTSPNIHVKQGFVSDEDFDGWIQASDCVILPYKSINSSSVGARAAMLGKHVLARCLPYLEDQFKEYPKAHFFRDQKDLSDIIKTW